MRHQVSSFSFDVPEDWCDITPEEDPTYPFTMALNDGVGVIQLSLAEWSGGIKPEIDSERLKSMFDSYCDNHRLAIAAVEFQNEKVVGIGGKHLAPEELFGAWYVSDGVNVALVTYIGQTPHDPASEAEFTVAESLVFSSRFEH